MRRVWLGLAVVFGLVLAAAGFLVAISEWGEVVVLRTQGSDGASASTRLWVVDDAGAVWLRSGGRERGWFAAVQANPEVELERGGRTAAFRAAIVDEPIARARIDALMRDKYGRSDRWIEALEGGFESIPVRLDPR